MRAQAKRWLLVIAFTASPARVIARTGDTAPSPNVNWRRLFQNVCSDQKDIWTSPLRAGGREAVWYGVFGAATAVLIATDDWTSRQLPNTPGQVRAGRIGSHLGAVYAVGPATAAFYAAGAIRHDGRLRETGLLGAEAVADSLLVTGALKALTRRQRPMDGNGAGSFWRGDSRGWDMGTSFPSGHSMQTWALAAVVAQEYPRPRIIPVASYSVAGAVMVSRFTARKHFASDVVAGAAIGWFIGDHVFHKRHRGEGNNRRSKLERVLVLAGFGR